MSYGGQADFLSVLIFLCGEKTSPLWQMRFNQLEAFLRVLCVLCVKHIAYRNWIPDRSPAASGMTPAGGPSSMFKVPVYRSSRSPITDYRFSSWVLGTGY